MNRLRHQKYKVLKIKNKIVELENDFNSINISMNNMDKFEKRTNKEQNIYKNNWYDWCDWLINYIPEPIKNRGWY